MRKEDRIACRGRENRHVTRHLVAVYGLPAADIDVHRAVRCIFQSIVGIQVVWIWSRDPTETKRDVLRGHGLKDGGTERGDTQSLSTGSLWLKPTSPPVKPGGWIRGKRTALAS